MDVTLKHQIAAQAASRFNLTEAQLSPLVGGHYAQVYEWQQDGHGFVLKIAPAERADDLQSTLAMMEWLAYLAAHGALVVRPVRSQAGNLVEPMDAAGQRYLVSAAAKIGGVRAELLPVDQWHTRRIEQLGRILGRCHALAQSYAPPSPLLTRPQWDQAGNCFNPDELATADRFVLEKRAGLLRQLQALPKDADCYGLAHLDIHFANFIVDAERETMVLIDFDDCAYGWYVMDIAMLLFDAQVVYAQERYSFGRTFFDALLAGYRSAKPLPEFWIAQLPTFLKLLEIGIYAMLVPDYDAATCQDTWVNTFMDGREQRIRDDVPYLG